MADVLNIAKVALEVQRAYGTAIDDTVPPPWETASEALKESMLQGVRDVLGNPGTTPEQNHESWRAYWTTQGWEHGKARDEAKQTHPNLVPWAKLPEKQRVRSHLFIGVVESMR